MRQKIGAMGRDTVRRRLKQSFLLHVCCAPCSTHVISLLKDEFLLKLLFYNPNIYPKEEYYLRLRETERIAEHYKIPLLKLEYVYESELAKWDAVVKGFEAEKEGGERCKKCYTLRLEETARIAAKEKIDYFGATLTISPLKKAEVVNLAGEKLGRDYGVKYYTSDFKKKNGFKKSCDISKELGLYRQDYCGCKYSIRR